MITPGINGFWNCDVDDAANSKQLEDITDPQERARVESALAAKRAERERLEAKRNSN